MKVFLSYNNISSSLGFESGTVIDKVARGIFGLEVMADSSILPEAFCASVVDAEKLDAHFSPLGDPEKYTRLEKLMCISLGDVISRSGLQPDERTGLIISTTKGNIDVLDTYNPFDNKRVYLPELGRVVKEFFGFKRDAVVVSNACVSGVTAITLAKKLIRAGVYDHVFVTGGDLVTRFVMSGFYAFQALSPERCKPYSKNRSGINIGEAAATVLVTKDKAGLPDEAVEILGEASCNDANHISGPSRTGEGLYRCIKNAMAEAGTKPEKISYISGHGTATPYNDEMESISIYRLDLQHAPINSLKSYFGHTLGAAGLLETIAGMHQLSRNTLFQSLGFDRPGISKPLNVITENRTGMFDTCLKTASGFGGCNAALVMAKVKK